MAIGASKALAAGGMGCQVIKNSRDLWLQVN